MRLAEVFGHPLSIWRDVHCHKLIKLRGKCRYRALHPDQRASTVGVWLPQRRAFQVAARGLHWALCEDTVQLQGWIRVLPRTDFSSPPFSRTIRTSPLQMRTVQQLYGKLPLWNMLCSLFSVSSISLQWSRWCFFSASMDGWRCLLYPCLHAVLCSARSRWYRLSGYYLWL